MQFSDPKMQELFDEAIHARDDFIWDKATGCPMKYSKQCYDESEYAFIRYVEEKLKEK